MYKIRRKVFSAAECYDGEVRLFSTNTDEPVAVVTEDGKVEPTKEGLMRRGLKTVKNIPSKVGKWTKDSWGKGAMGKAKVISAYGVPTAAAGYGAYRLVKARNARKEAQMVEDANGDVYLVEE